jgi:predicted HTH domain antitoxin
MKRMNDVVTLRLPKEDVKMVERLAIEARKDKSTTLRELVELGKVYLAIRQYREGKISLGKAAEIAGMSISETMDLFAELKIESNITMEDYLEGLKTAREIL